MEHSLDSRTLRMPVNFKGHLETKFIMFINKLSATKHFNKHKKH